MAIEFSELEHLKFEEVADQYDSFLERNLVDTPSGQSSKTFDLSLYSIYNYNTLGNLLGNELYSLGQVIRKNLLAGIMPNGQKMLGGEIFSVDDYDYAWSKRNEVAYRLGKIGEKVDRVIPSCNLHKKVQSKDVGSLVDEKEYKFLVAFAHDQFLSKDKTRQAIKLDHPLESHKLKDGLLFRSNGVLHMWYDQMVYQVISAKRVD